jgi:hypothetical protein
MPCVRHYYLLHHHYLTGATPPCPACCHGSWAHEVSRADGVTVRSFPREGESDGPAVTCQALAMRQWVGGLPSWMCCCWHPPAALALICW